MVDQGAVIHMERGNSFMLVKGKKIPIMFEGARAYVGARVVAAVGEEGGHGMAAAVSSSSAAAASLEQDVVMEGAGAASSA
eukprot:8310002-Prorocentrum_lima.AAC.1